MPGYGVANPGSLIGFVFLVCCFSTSTWPMRPSKFTPSLCTGEGGVFGGMYFYHGICNFMPMPNAAFGSSLISGSSHLASRHLLAASLAIISKQKCAELIGRGPGLRGGGSGVELGGRPLFCFCTLARFARLVLLAAGLLACLALCCASAWFFLVTTRHPFWFVLVPAEGNRFALGTGGIRWSLLVGGLGPVLSIPKLCFKPFRKNDSGLLPNRF